MVAIHLREGTWGLLGPVTTGVPRAEPKIMNRKSGAAGLRNPRFSHGCHSVKLCRSRDAGL